MELTPKLTAALAELKSLTGIQMDISAGSPEEMDLALEQVRCLCTAYKEKYNKTYFLECLMTGSLPGHDIKKQALRLHIPPDEQRVLFLLETPGPLDDTVAEILRNLFPAQTKTFLIPVSGCRLAVVRSLHATETEKDVSRLACIIVDTLNTEALASVRIAYSAIFGHLSQLPEAYRQSSLALKVGCLFYSEQTIFPYDRLGIGRLICHLPKAICLNFLEEVFCRQAHARDEKKISLDTADPRLLDPELIASVDRFFQNNLNIAETARQLHMHRNTLIYRLDQLQKRTGLDVRDFEDAMTFKIAVMIINYLERSTPNE